MANVQQTSFTTPSYDYGADLSQIERRRAMAQALQQQGMTPVAEQPVGAGQFATRISPFQDAAKLAQTYAGMRQQKKADTEQRELAAKTQKELADVLRRGQLAASGTPATALSEDASGNVTPAQPAVAGDLNKAAGIYMQHPMTAQMGMGIAQKEMEGQQRQQLIAKMFPGSQSPLNPSSQNPSVMAGSGGAGYQPPTGGAPQPQGAPGPASNPFAGMPKEVIALMTSGDPELAKLGATLLEANKGIAQRPGAPVVNPFTGAVIAQPTPSMPQGIGLNVGPNGPSAFQVPGFAGAQAGINAIPNPSAPPQKLATSGGQELQLTQPEYVQWQQTGQLPARFGGKPQGSPLQTGQGGIPNLAQQAGAMPGLGNGGLPAAPSAVRPPSQGIGVPGLSQSQQDQINQARQQAGGKAVDEAFAKDYATFIQGGAQDAAKQLSQLRDVSIALKDPKANLTGTLVGNTPDALNTIANPKAVAMRERVEEVVQRSLRAILGAQFTEKEGERLIARAYNPRLSEKENAVRVDRLLTQLDGAYKSKIEASRYFEKNGTLEGFRGRMPNMADFDPDSKTGAGAAATIQFKDLP